MRQDLTVADQRVRGQLASSSLAALAQQSASSSASQRTETGLRWDRYFAALWRFKFLIVFLFGAGSTAGYFYSKSVQPEYQAEAQAYVARIARSTDGVGPVRSEGGLTAAGWMSLPKSLAILDRVVQKLQLYLTPLVPADSLVLASLGATNDLVTGRYTLETDPQARRFRLSDPVRGVADSGIVGDSIGRHFGFLWAPAELSPNLRVTFDVVKPRDIAAALQTQLLVNLPEQANILSISLTGGHPERIARTVNGVLDEFIDFATRTAKRNQTTIRETLHEQLLLARVAYDSAEDAHQNYLIQIATEPTERQSFAVNTPNSAEPVWSNYYGLRDQRANVTRDSAALHAILTAVENKKQSPNAFRTIESVRNLGIPLIRALDNLMVEEETLAEYGVTMTEDAPQVYLQRQRVSKIEASIVMAAQSLLEQLGGSGANLDDRIKLAMTDLKGIPERTVTAARLSNDVTIRNSIRTQLESQYAHAQMAEGSAMADVGVMVRAYTPMVPSSSPQSRLFGMAVLVSLAVAVALALLLDRLDKRVRYSEQVASDLGLLILGAIPHTRHVADWRSQPGSAAGTVEAFRSVRLAISQAFSPGQPIAVTITSTGQGEGKSLVSENLALAFADGGYKTLLIDGDTRRGELHSTFGVERRSGLLDHLAGRAALSDIVKETSTKNLWLLPAGTRFKRGPELLMSPALAPMLAELSSHYDAILIDTPPLAAGVDALVLGSTVGNMLMVVRHGKTDRKMAGAKLELVDRLPVRVLGAVLNDTRGGWGYEQYAYIDGYTAEEELGETDLEHPSLGAREKGKSLAPTKR